MDRPTWRLLGAAVLSLSLLTGCGSSSDDTESATTRTFAADGGDVSIPAQPKRVVATGYAVPALIESGADLVGVSAWSRGLPLMSAGDVATYEKLKKVAGETADSTDYEAIAALEPDLIVLGVPQPALVDIDMDRLESIAPVAAIGPTVPSAWRELTQRYADVAGTTKEYESSKARYEAKAAKLKTKYATALQGRKFGHLGAYGDVSAGTFMREFEGSWGTNIASDTGVTYYGEVEKKKGGAEDVGEYPSIEQLSSSFAQADDITYSLDADGSVGESVQYVLDSPVWKNLPAVKAGRVYALPFTEAATYTQAMKALDGIDEALAPLLTS